VVKTLEETPLEANKVILRTDLNLPIEDGEPRKTIRFKRYLKTIQKLSEENAKTVILAHQGRPTRKDFTSLEKHSQILSNELNQEVKLVQSFFGQNLEEAINSMENGDVILLENIRFLSEELQNVKPEIHKNDFFVKTLAENTDIFVNDAFSAAHRTHGSIVGFTPIMDSYAGIVMENEFESCKKIRDDLEDPVLVLGGEKPSDIIRMLNHMIEDVDKVLLGGVPGELALMIQGRKLGQKSDWIKEQGFDKGRKDLENLLEQYKDKIIVPKDVKTDSGNYLPENVPEDDMVWDIGSKTQEKYSEIIENTDSVLMKGPMGAFEDKPEGTKSIIDALADTEAFTVLGGGHTSSLVERFNREMDEFSHVSIAGGAFVRFMSGEDLPAIKTLQKYS